MTNINVDTLVGSHSHFTGLKPGADRELAQLAAAFVAEAFATVGGNTREQSQEYERDLAKLLTVSCSCGQSDCFLATTEFRGYLNGLKLGSLIAMSYGVADQLRSRRDNAPLLPPVNVVIKLPDPINVALQPSAGVLVDYDADGKVKGTRPRD